MSAPFIDQIFTWTQPDGTTFQVRGSGNQERAVFETLDGFAIVKDPKTGFYHRARRDAAGARVAAGEPLGGAALEGLEATGAFESGVSSFEVESLTEGMAWRARLAESRAEAGGLEFAPPSRETTGDVCGLCLLIRFKDDDASVVAFTHDEVDAFCNDPNYALNGNRGSVSAYFRDVSAGRLRCKTIVAPYYTAKHKREYYTDPRQPWGKRPRELVAEAVEAARALNLSVLTVDSEKRVRALNVFYTGKCTNAWSQGLWPHASYLPGGLALGPGRKAHDYQVTDMGDVLTLGVFCHETGHMLCDFPDLYDTDKGSENTPRGVGRFCCMCIGCHNDYGRNPSSVSAYLKLKAGWCASLIEMKPGTNVTLRNGANEMAIFKKNEKEYFLAEVRSQAARDQHIPDAGLAIWHVDETGSNSREEQTAQSHYECTLVQADGLSQIESENSQGDAADLFAPTEGVFFSDTTKPSARWWNGAASGLTLSKLRQEGEAFSFQVG